MILVVTFAWKRHPSITKSVATIFSEVLFCPLQILDLLLQHVDALSRQHKKRDRISSSESLLRIRTNYIP